MHSFFPRSPLIHRTIYPALALGGVWFAGVSLGLWAARFHGDPVRALSLTAADTALRFSGACVVTMLPLFLSAFAVFFFHRLGAYLFCTCRGILIGFSLGCVVDAGGFWLGLLLLFSGLFSSPVLLWFLWRRLELDMRRFLPDCAWALAALMAIAAMDTWVAAPFLERALSF